MRIEVLISAMNQTNFDLVEKNNIRSDALIINQCDRYDYAEKSFDKYLVKMISTNNRGLSRSRNEALLNATGDVCLLCDDDVTYKDNYVQIIKEAFKKLPDADIIVFNTEKMNCSDLKKRKHIEKIRIAPKHKNYGSVRVAFKLRSFKKNNIWFNVNFGAGSIYSSGEESLMFREANKKGLKIYEYPAFIANVDYSNSTWFEGHNAKFFFNIGAWLSVAYPKSKHLFKYYYPISFNNHCSLTKKEIIHYINQGINSYNNLCGFAETHT
ncbi:glycosyltransferase family 2 protein [Tissierella sp. MSJ-40]|uniref:Glycosyltransferase family 2 protein n=1 Tax=Tissierella simiarum TaxID=2841534 RepID=A0ABS6E1Z6_9FIRM|nr:glycosyltransferase family 2 protein [Tissierella simiarum]MBU5436819.1 glycosyltransferase family 2 protein [Tissierella simiarum]